MSLCPACQNTEPVIGTDHRCAFETGIFSSRNWRCKTLSEIRKLVDRLDRIKINGIDFVACITEQRYATINLSSIDALQDCDGDQPICLWVGWYKNRGRTEGMWLMFEDIPPRPPTLTECLLIINYYETQINKGVNNGMA